MSTHTSGADLGRAVHRSRKAHGLKIEDLAFAAEMHPTYLSGIERGLRNPTWCKLCGLADALGVSVSALAGEAEAVIARTARAARARLRARSVTPDAPPTRQRAHLSNGPIPAPDGRGRIFDKLKCRFR
jgi:transcriptional regulator with XRE-family HTH domain